MKRILLISNYKQGMGGIHAQVEMLHSHLNQEEGIAAYIFSTKGNTLIRVWKFLCLMCIVVNYDILHIHACSYRGMLPAVLGIIAGKLHRKKIIITYHGGEANQYFAKHTKFVRRWLGKADKVIVLSGFLKEIFNRYNIQSVIIPNIIELHPIVKQESINYVAPRFISIRHLESLYNIPCILKAYKKVLEQYPNASLDILGQGSLRDQLIKYVQNNNLTGVRFLGQVPNSEIYSYLKKATIILSAPKADNMPVSLLEAINAGLLVISSKVGGVPYMIAHQQTGLLFESGNVEQMAEQMIWALEHPKEVNDIIVRAQQDVQKYSWENVKQQLFKVYG